MKIRARTVALREDEGERRGVADKLPESQQNQAHTTAQRMHSGIPGRPERSPRPVRQATSGEYVAAVNGQTAASE